MIDDAERLRRSASCIWWYSPSLPHSAARRARKVAPAASNSCGAESLRDSAPHQSIPGPWALGPVPCALCPVSLGPGPSSAHALGNIQSTRLQLPFKKPHHFDERFRRLRLELRSRSFLEIPEHPLRLPR